MSESDEQKIFPWKAVGYFNLFEKASKKRNNLLKSNDKLQVKIKRCGQGGNRFMVKARLNPQYVLKIEKKKKNAKQKKKK